MSETLIRRLSDKEARAIEQRWIETPDDLPSEDAKAYLVWVLMRSAKRGLTH